MLLQDLPKKTRHRLLKSVTWAEVEGGVTIKSRLRRLISRVAQSLIPLFAVFKPRR
jgi:hypothetical protein